MSEKIVYHSHLEDVAHQGLLSLCAEAMEVNGTSLAGQSLEELQKLDQVKCKEKLALLKTEINDLIANAPYEGVKVMDLGS
jgi:hypothetical protein